MDPKIKTVLDYIKDMKRLRSESIEKFTIVGIHSLADAYSLGYDKGSLSDLEFVEFLLNS